MKPVNQGVILVIYPRESVDEIKGRLVKHTWKFCTVLENETKKSSVRIQGIRRVVTPRVNKMGSLSIKWQHKHERGSGGAGCVGFSGSGLANTKRLGIKTSLRDNMK
jgi:hypothetical protein